MDSFRQRINTHLVLCGSMTVYEEFRGEKNNSVCVFVVMKGYRALHMGYAGCDDFFVLVEDSGAFPS